MNARLGKNSLWLFTARLGAQALMVLFTVLLARRLGSAGFGEYAFLAATLVIGNLLTTFGTDMLLMREIAARQDFSGLPAALLLQLGLSALFVTFIQVGAPFFPNQSPSAVLALRIYSLALFPLAFYTVFTSALRGLERMNSYALLGLASVVPQVAVALFLPPGGLVVLAGWLLLIQIAVTGLAGLLCIGQIPVFWRDWRFSASFFAAAFTPLIRASAPSAGLALLGMFYQKLSLYLLSALAGATLTGWFAAALRAVEASKTVHLAVFTALYPAMARNEPGSAGIFHRIWLFLLLGAALIALSLSLLAAPLIRLLFGPDFLPAIPALRILAWMLVPYTVNTYLTLTLVAAKHEWNVAVALSASLLALILLSLGWIPRLGLAGAAWAALFAESLQALLLLVQPGLIQRGEIHEFSKLS
jgi:O-antigen/teichoic acid export membrane protein